METKKITQYKDWYISNKKRNKQIKMLDGNKGKALNLVHWNMGHKKWHNKLLEVRQAVADFQPDLFVITEENLMDEHPNGLSVQYVQGYDLIKPDTMATLKYCRIVVLARGQSRSRSSQ